MAIPRIEPSEAPRNWPSRWDQLATSIEQEIDNATPGGGASASVATNESTTSASFTDLATVGPEVTLALNEVREVLVIVSAQLKSATSSYGAFMSFAVSGATTRAAAIEEALDKYGVEWTRASAATRVTLNAGTNTLTAKYQSSSVSHAASFLRRAITVVPL